MESNRVILKAQRYWKLESIVRDIAARLAKTRVVKFTGKLEETIQRYREIECAYVLDEKGVQVSGTVFANDAAPRNNKLFSPASPGADHSLKVYYHYLKYAELDKYLTEPYSSLANGNLCRTFSCFFRRERKTYVLCLDFKASPMEF
jgi:hypothetical protein